MTTDFNWEEDLKKIMEIIRQYGVDTPTGKALPIIEIPKSANSDDINMIEFSNGWYQILRYLLNKYGSECYNYIAKLYSKLIEIKSQQKFFRK